MFGFFKSKCFIAKQKSAGLLLCKCVKNIVNEFKKDMRGPFTYAYYILDPKQNMKCSVEALASQITGPFFSRSSAEEYLNFNSHQFSMRALVYGISANPSKLYSNLLEVTKTVAQIESR